MKGAPAEELFARKEIAAHFKRHRATIYRWECEGLRFRNGRISLREVTAFLERRDAARRSSLNLAAYGIDGPELERAKKIRNWFAPPTALDDLIEEMLGHLPLDPESQRALDIAHAAMASFHADCGKAMAALDEGFFERQAKLAWALKNRNGMAGELVLYYDIVADEKMASEKRLPYFIELERACPSSHEWPRDNGEATSRTARNLARRLGMRFTKDKRGPRKSTPPDAEISKLEHPLFNAVDRLHEGMRAESEELKKLLIFLKENLGLTTREAALYMKMKGFSERALTRALEALAEIPH